MATVETTRAPAKMGLVQPALLLIGVPVATIDLTSAGFPGCYAYTPLTGLLVPIGALDATGSSLPATRPLKPRLTS